MISTLDLKQLNTSRVKSALLHMKEGTKNTLADATGLSVATCGNILNDLLKTGEVIELSLADSTGGRPSRRFSYNKDYAYIGCLYLSNAYHNHCIAYTIFNMAGEIVHSSKLSVQAMSLKELDQVIALMIEAYPDIKSLAIGIPGVVKDGHILSCDFEQLAKFDLCGYIEEKFQVMTLIENDINATALGYYDQIGNDDTESIAYLYFPHDYCPGAGFIVNGQILRGISNFAGEVGHLPVKHKIDIKNLEKLTPERIAHYIAEIVAAINCIINPAQVILSIKEIDEPLFDQVLMILYEIVPQGHQPKLIYKNDIHSSYMHGLKLLAQETL